MNDNDIAVRTYFAKLDLEPEVADIYLALYAHGPQTISELARSAEVERTRIYRLLDKLKNNGLVEVETQYKRSILRPAPISNLHVLISRKEQAVKALQSELTVIESMLSRNTLESPSTRVQFYQGPSGIKQMLWNETKATTEVVVILANNMQSRTREAFFERWVRRANEQQIRFRGIVGDEFIQTQRRWYARRQNERLQHWEARYVPPEVFAITTGLTVYNDVVNYQHWQDGEVFGIEVHNRQIARLQRQLFELLWSQGTPMDDVGRPAQHT